MQPLHPSIVALTAHAMAGHSDTYRAAGMDGFVSKPFNIDVLVSEMMRAIAETRNIGEGPRPIVEAGGGENDDEEEPSLLAQRALNGMLDELEKMTAGARQAFSSLLVAAGKQAELFDDPLPRLSSIAGNIVIRHRLQHTDMHVDDIELFR